MNITIANRIAQFLEGFKPFNFLDFESLVEISSNISILHLEKDKSLFQINDTLQDSFYVIHSGVLHLTVISDSEEVLLNKCYPGDIFGLRPFFAKNNYQMNAKSREDCIIYAIPIDVFKPFLSQNSEILNYLLESFATNTKSSLDKENNNKIVSNDAIFASSASDISFLQSLNYNQKPILVSRNQSIKDVATLMSDNLQGNAVIVENDLPIGIVTDSDFRTKIATGKFEIWAKIENIMKAPVLTVSENISVAEAQLLVLKYNISHLCVTQDGTEKSSVKGVISEHDLIEAQANNPGILLKEIKRSFTVADLQKVSVSLMDIIHTSIFKNIPIHHLNTVTGEIILAIIKRATELAILEMGSAPVAFALLSIGSQGRKEQLLLTDHETILIFDDVSPDNYKDVKDYFLKLATKLTDTIEQLGFQLSKFGHNANNTLWCKSLSDWTKQYNAWMNVSKEKDSDSFATFFDYELIYGEQKFEDILTENIFSKIKNNALFFDYLGNDALRKPAALNFFKKFNTEEDGKNKGKFDIETKAISPLIETARLLVLSLNIKGINNTYLRFKQLAIADSKNAEIYLDCAEAFQMLSRFRTIEGLKNDSNGQFINIDELSKIDKEKLKNALAPMRELEEVIKDKFQLTQFS